MSEKEWKTIVSMLFHMKDEYPERYNKDNEFISFIKYAQDQRSLRRFEQLSADDQSIVRQYLNEELPSSSTTCEMDNVEKIINKLATTKYELDRRYITDVCVAKEDDIRNNILDYLCNVSLDHKGKIFIVSEHKDHVHIVHDCKYRNGQCKCKFREYGQISTRLRKRVGHRKHISELSMRDWQNVFAYFIVFKPQTRRQIWCDRTVETLPSDTESNRWYEINRGPGQLLEISRDGDDVTMDPSDLSFQRVLQAYQQTGSQLKREGAQRKETPQYMTKS